MQLAMGELAAILGSSSQSPDRLVQGYSIDSRTIRPGQLFFAICGPRFDGHRFVQSAIDAGAAGAVVEQSFCEHASPSLSPYLVPAADTARALQQLAQAVRRKWRGRLVAVTGSTGKSTTKELITSLLAERFRVHKSPGNLNNQFGLPLALLALEPEHEAAVVELAMSAAGEIAQLARVAEPDIGVVTNVAPVHLEFFESVDSIAAAKRELIDNLRAPATAVLNHDDVRVRRFAQGFTGRVVTFGFSEGADMRAFGVRPHGAGGSEFQVIGRSFSQEFYLPLPGRHNISNALAAIATAKLFDIPAVHLREALGRFKNLHQRGEILTLPGPITIINDCYNSNPLAMERMLETLAAWPESRRRIVVAGEMLELGPSAPEWHRQIGRKCAEAHVDWLVAVRGNASFFLEGAIEQGLPCERTRFFPSAAEAGAFCQSLLEPGDVVLIKGSRGVHLEAVTELLLSRTEGSRARRTA